MTATMIAFLAAFSLSSNAPVPPPSETLDHVESQAPSEPKILEATADDVLQPDGLRARWASVTYALEGG